MDATTLDPPSTPMESEPWGDATDRNPDVADLKRQWAEWSGDEVPTSLWIVPGDSQHTRLVAGLADHVLVLAALESLDALEESSCPPVLEAIEFACRELNLSNIVVCGHNVCGGSSRGLDRRAQVADEKQSTIARWKRLATSFADDGDEHVHCLFYIEESGVLLSYSETLDDFVLVERPAAG